MKFQVKGSCHCENIQVNLELSTSPQSISPRACDCDFCMKVGASYISDPNGSIQVDVKDKSALGKYQQGSNSADFLFCQKCGVFVGPFYTEDSKVYAAINSRILESNDFAAPTVVSPKKLNANEKTTRWKQVWFPQVVFK